jgi:hypothetical protein
MLAPIQRALILFVLGTAFTSLTVVFITNVITDIPLVIGASRTV